MRLADVQWSDWYDEDLGNPYRVAHVAKHKDATPTKIYSGNDGTYAYDMMGVGYQQATKLELACIIADLVQVNRD